MAFHVPEEYRCTEGPLGSDAAAGNNGCFLLERVGGKRPLRLFCIASDGGDWEHVSVSLNRRRCPTCEELCAVKALFWDDTDTVVQYHPAHSEYVNNHPYCLHLWRPVNGELPTPPPLMVGVRPGDPPPALAAALSR